MGYSALTNAVIMSPNHSGSRYNSISKDYHPSYGWQPFNRDVWKRLFKIQTDKHHLTTELILMDVLHVMSMKRIIRGHPPTGKTTTEQSLLKLRIVRLVAIGQSAKKHMHR